MLLLFLLSFLLFVHPSHTSCSSCGAATAAGTCILASATECGTLIFYDTPVFTYDSNDGGCKTVTVKCRGQEWIYSTTRLDDGTPALCTPSRCECDGVSTQNVKCTDALCPFPAPTCCPRFVKKKDIVLKKYTCQPE
ncbi:unnamed protein product, partial [Mesorhabditis belari]|uniref:Uncharacterized protein n=1 Tax=Mesorhabditis belari TaxID=2138241 RepID=A0AAF3FKQ6_9BILA